MSDYKAILEVSASTVFQAIVDMAVDYKDVDLAIADVSIDGLCYMVEYGYQQSLQDAVSGVAKATLAILTAGDAAKRNELAKVAGIPVNSANDAIVAGVIRAKMEARRKAIIEGTIGGGRTGPRRVGIDKIMAEIAFDELKAIATKTKKSLPTKAADLNPMIEARLAKRGDAIRAEAERRMALLAEIESED